MTENTRINLTIDRATHEKLRALAYEQRTTIPELIRQAVEAALEPKTKPRRG